MLEFIIWDFRSPHRYESHDIVKRELEKLELRIAGFRVEHADKEPETEDGVPVIRAGSKVMLRLFGSGFLETTKIGLTTEKLEYGAVCNMMITTGFFTIIRESSANARVEVLLPKNSVELFFCATNEDNVNNFHDSSRHNFNIFFFKKPFYHQGSDSWMSLRSSEPLLPTWVQVVIIVTCLCFSALFSGLNLGLMSLDRTDLKVS